MKYHFLKGEILYMTEIREDGDVYEKIVQGEVKYCEDKMEVTSLKNLSPIMFYDYLSQGIDLRGNLYNIHKNEKEAELALQNMLQEQSLRKEVQKMVSEASVKQLEAIYSYMIAEKDKEEKK